jgi:hypothetical protein
LCHHQGSKAGAKAIKKNRNGEEAKVTKSKEEAAAWTINMDY